MKNPSVPCRAGVSSNVASLPSADAGRLAADARRPRFAPRQRRKVGMVREKPRDLVAILLRQHRAGDVDEPAAGLDQRRRRSSRMARCSLLALGEIGGLQPPLGIGPPAPGAACRCRGHRRTPDRIGARAPPAPPRRRRWQHLDVARAGPLEPLEDRPQPRRVVVVGIDLAGVAHGGGEGQRLAAGACTNIEHLLARAGGGHQRGDLRALVLHLVPAAPVPDLGLDIGLPARTVRRRQPHADRRQRRRLRVRTAPAPSAPCRGRP